MVLVVVVLLQLPVPIWKLMEKMEKLTGPVAKRFLSSTSSSTSSSSTSSSIVVLCIFF